MGKVSNKKLEEIYFAFREKLAEKIGRDIYLLKIPTDKLVVSVNGKARKAHILDVYKDKFGLDMNGLRKMGWATGRGPFKGTFYVIPPSLQGERKNKTADTGKADIEL